MKFSAINKLVPGSQVGESLLRKNNSNYWHFTIGTGSTESVLYYPTFDFDSSGNIFVLGNNTYFYKINVAERKLDFFKRISSLSTGNQPVCDDLIYDRTNNRFFITGYSTVGSYNKTYVLRMNSDGTVHSSALTQELSNQSSVPTNHSCALDSSGNIYVPYYLTGKGTGGSYYSAGWFKFAPALGYQAKSTIYQAGNFYDYEGKVRVDSSNNVYFINTTNYNTESRYATAISKRNSSGTELWTPRRLYNSTNYNNLYYTDGDIDSSGNIFSMGFGANTNSGSVGISVNKWTTNGGISWRRLLTLSGLQLDNSVQRKITTDSSGNVYVAFIPNTGSDLSYIARYNSDGTLSWVMEYTFGYEGRGYNQSGDDASAPYGGPTIRVFNNDLYVLGAAYYRTPFGSATIETHISKLPISSIIPGKYYLKRNNFISIKDVTSSFTSTDASTVFTDESYTAATHSYTTSPIYDNTTVTTTVSDLTTAYETSFIPLSN